MNKIGTKLYLDKELIIWIKAEAKKQHCSMAQVVRTAIVKLMEERSK